ncbi:MAG: replication-associated recombination protein A [Candidatus Pacebacteria bacterium]|nr:replication-associated recombination protein A [Candidatus Paceibacterota bacterium]
MTSYNIQPLADKFRPKTLEDFVGQKEAVGKNSFLKTAILKDSLSSLIFWGPAGVGKTTLALIIANQTKAEFLKLSATSSGLKDLRALIEKAEVNKRLGKKTILFIDEIHRWSKSQQDALLPHVESGTLILIGATTENPSFEINSALLSRAQVIVLERLENSDLKKIINRVEKDLKLKISEEAKDIICQLASGDARQALNILEKALVQGKKITKDTLANTIKKLPIYYDKKSDEHYNLISALHKSMRGNDANASVYWLTRMLEGGEDPLYIARRLIRFASEDIGLANNSALMLANSAFEACHKIGMPECAVILSHTVIYLAKSKKSILAYSAYNKAKAEVEKSGNLRPPLHILNAPTDFMKKLGYGRDYKYTPLEDSSDQNYLPEIISKKKFLDQ